jgi:hypothetical protein
MSFKEGFGNFLRGGPAFKKIDNISKLRERYEKDMTGATELDNPNKNFSGLIEDYDLSEDDAKNVKVLEQEVNGFIEEKKKNGNIKDKDGMLLQEKINARTNEIKRIFDRTLTKKELLLKGEGINLNKEKESETVTSLPKDENKDDPSLAA